MKKIFQSKFLLVAAAVASALACPADADACTNLIAGKKATKDGSVMFSYSADSHTLYGELGSRKAAKHAPGTMRKVVEWDTGKYLGDIPEAAQTYNVVGNMNEHQVAIGESTWGGREELVDTTGNSIIDYGSLIQIALERSKTAREAIKIMTSLVDKYGYASSGESFTIADKNEVWVMELIGKGAEKGAVWVAVRIPDNAISGHANEPRIRKVNFKDKENILASKDVVSFARKRGYFNGKDEDFSFADAYDVHSPATRRSCDARVWSYFRRYASEADSRKWFEWCAAETDEPMPLYIIPDKKVSLEDMQAAMRDHFEGTPFDMTADIGAGGHKVPYRWRPMRYDIDGETYVHERAIATQQTGWSFVAQCRDWLPDPVGGLFWFGTDDTNTSVYMPFYCSMTEVPLEVKPGNGDLLTYSSTSNFWMTNIVANEAYSRYDQMIPDIRKVQSNLEKAFIETRVAQDAELKALYDAGKMSELQAAVNREGADVARQATDAYRELGIYLLVKYLDGNRKKLNDDGTFKRNAYGLPAAPDTPGYSKEYYENIVRTDGDRVRLKKK